MSNVYTRFVEVGRVCQINYGPDAGKLCVIVDIVDNTRALVDGPSSINGFGRQPINFKRLSLTDLRVNIGRGARLRTLVKAYNEAEIEKKWAQTSLARKQASRAKRASAKDFDRFKIQLARSSRNRIVNKQKNLIKAK